MTLAQCLELPPPPELPPLRIPNFGTLEVARQSLYDMPDLSNYIMRLQDAAAVALAPLRRMLELMELMVAFKQCMQAIPDALLPPSPGPILDCLKTVFKAFATLLAYIPPFSYIPTLVDIVDYAVLVVDEIVALFELLDNKITQQKAALIDALELGDLELVDITDCVSGETTQLVVNSMDILKFMTPVVSAMLSPLARLIPEPTLKKKLEELADIPATLTGIQDTIENTTGPPVLGPLVDTMFILRNLAVIVANIADPLVGGDADRVPKEPPTFDNF